MRVESPRQIDNDSSSISGEHDEAFTPTILGDEHSADMRVSAQ
jgi:hypothetical protein